ncbi:minor capsid protein [Hominibacterium faecale]|uniref:minor capsid protein n=1 Tax=Hominibacterium faecale TaxID=2839743 RepID=UPI0022B29C17|nr:minor capsid protein [Hominibacterium faecale]
MNNQDYWERRKAQQMYEDMESAEKMARQLSRLYLQASRDIQEQARKIFEKYQSKHGMTKAEAEMLLKAVKDPGDINQLLDLLKKDPKNQDLIKEIESQAYGARIGHLNNLYNQLETVAMAIYAEQNKRFYALLTKLAKKAYYNSIFDMQQYSGYGFSFKVLDQKTIEKALSSRWHGQNYSERIWGNTQKLAKSIRKEIMLNLLTGRPLRDASLAIEKRFAAGYSEARRLVRTESAFICNHMQLQSYEASGIKKYIYLAILDLKTSAVCRSLDKKRFPVSEATPGKNYPPMHPWCRSTTLADMPDEWLRDMKQSAIDPSTGKRITVPGDMTYQQWYDKFVRGRTEAEERKHENRFIDKQQHEKYRGIFGDDIPESLEKFQRLKYNNPKEWERLKAAKQERLNQLDFSQMDALIGKLGNKEVRSWYKAHDEKIPSLIDKSLPLEQQARQACELRRTYKKQARDLMKDQEARKLLDMKRPIQTFEDILNHKRQKYGLEGEEACKDIIRSSTTTNKEYDRKAGVDRDEK